MTIDHDGLRIYICTPELLMEVDFNVILLNSSQYQINKVGNKKRDRRGLILFSPAYIVQVYMGVLSQKCVRSYPNNTDELLVWGNLRYGQNFSTTGAQNELSRCLKFHNQCEGPYYSLL